MNSIEKFFDWLDPSIVALLVMFIAIVLVVWSWHRDKDRDFHLQQVLVDSVTGKIAIEKVGYMTALAVTTWAFVALIVKDKMTEGYYTAYLGVFALSRAVSSATAVWKDKQ